MKINKLISIQELNKNLSDLNIKLTRLKEGSKIVEKDILSRTHSLIKSHIHIDFQSCSTKELFKNYVKQFHEIDISLIKIIKKFNNLWSKKQGFLKEKIGRCIKSLTTLYHSIYKNDYQKVLRQLRNQRDLGLGSGICFGHASALAIQEAKSRQSAISNKTTMRLGRFNQAIYNLDYKLIEKHEFLQRSLTSNVASHFSIEKKIAILKDLPHQLHGCDLATLPQKKPNSYQKLDHLDLAMSKRQTKLSDFSTPENLKSKFQDTTFSISSPGGKFMEQLPKTLKTMDRKKGSYLLGLHSIRNATPGHTVYMTFNPPSYCDTNDRHFVSGIPNLRTFKTVDEMIHSFTQWISDHCKKRNYEIFYLEKMEKAQKPCRFFHLFGEQASFIKKKPPKECPQPTIGFRL